MVKIDKEKPSYLPFYKVMLILSTIGTSFGALGLAGLSETLARYPVAPVFITCAVLLNVVTAVSIYALILLWQKNSLGISLKLSTYVVSIAVTIVGLANAQPYISHVIDITKDQLRVNSPQLTEQAIELVPSVVNFMVYGGLVGSIIISVTFALLWRAAWRKQKEADESPASHHHQKKA